MFSSDPWTIYLFLRNSVIKQQEGPERASVFLYFYLASRCLAFAVLFFVSLHHEQDTLQQAIQVIKIINMSQPSVFISSFSSWCFVMSICMQFKILWKLFSTFCWAKMHVIYLTIPQVEYLDCVFQSFKWGEGGTHLCITLEGQLWLSEGYSVNLPAYIKLF